MNRFEFVTDTATFCAFDLASMRHRLHDADDWWSIPEEELAEVNKGNAAIVGLGEDGKFIVELTDAEIHGGKQQAFVIHCPSGQVFLGAGEEMTSGGLQPEAVRGGAFVDVRPGTYQLVVRKTSRTSLSVSMTPYVGTPGNFFEESARI